MPDVVIKVDENKLRSVQKLLRDVPKAFPKVVSRSINKSALHARAESVRKLSKIINLKLKRIRKDIHVSKATYSRWRADVQVRGWRIPLKEFATSRIIPTGNRFNRPKSGLSYKIEKGGVKKTLPHAFYAKMSSGHIGLFERKGKSRLPISEKFGPSIGGIFANAKDMVNAVTIDAYKDLENNLDTQVELILKKATSIKGAA